MKLKHIYEFIEDNVNPYIQDEFLDSLEKLCCKYHVLFGHLSVECLDKEN